MGGMIRPVAAATIRLSGPAPDDPLLIDPNVLACEADLDSLVAAVELVRRMGASDALCGVGRAWSATRARTSTTDEDAAPYVRDTAITYHHQVGTCKMGTDEAAVVDPRLRVHGVDGPAGRRRLDHADGHHRQHQRAVDHDRRARGRLHQRRLRVRACLRRGAG